MLDSPTPRRLPPEFTGACQNLRSAPSRPELIVTEIPAPSGLAPHAIAFAANITPRRHVDDSDLATGRFVFLYDPQEPDAWDGPFRIVCFAQAPLETELEGDPFVRSVAWSWLVDGLRARGARFASISGTVTETLSTGYGELARDGDGAQIELRASWTPRGAAFASQLGGWGELLCTLASLPPESEGVSVLSRHRASSA